MKKLLIFLTLISFSVMAAQYGPLSQVESGALTGVYTKVKKCQAKYPNDTCIKIPSGYSNEYHKASDEMIDDLDDSVSSKSEVNDCADECQSVFDQGITCIDKKEKPILNLELKQIYCSKFVRYNKKKSGRKIIKEDADKKAAYKARKAAEKLAAKKSRDKIKALKKKLKDGSITNDEKTDLLLELL